MFQGLSQVLNNEGFAYLRQKFLKIGEAKPYEGK
jgi:hypothetical protein